MTTFGVTSVGPLGACTMAVSLNASVEISSRATRTGAVTKTPSIIMRKAIIITAIALLAASLAVAPSVAGAANDQEASELLTAAHQRNDAAGAYVSFGSGRIQWVSSSCKATLESTGVDAIEIGYGDLAARLPIATQDRQSCAAILSDLAPSSQGARLYVTIGTYLTSKGSFVVTADGRTRVSATCRSKLLHAGIPTVIATIEDLDSIGVGPAHSCGELSAQILDSGTSTPARPTPEPAPPTPSPAPASEWLLATSESVTYRDNTDPTSYAFFDPDDNNDPSWGRSRIGWLVECEPLKFERVDPIVAPDQPASAHLHEFFGNANVDPFTTTSSLVDTPLDDIDCTDKNDKSAYWAPAVFQNGKRTTAKKFKAYYKSTTPDTEPMPLGLRMVAGNAKATENQPENIGWFERQRSNDLTPNTALSNTREQTEMIQRGGASTIVLRINFPNCWDGEHLDSPDHQSHVAYFDETSKTCPASHPVKIPQLTTFTRYDVAGGEEFELASGPWYTFHQDFWNAWSPDQMAELNQRCILDELNCRIRPSRALEQLGQYEDIIG